MRQFGGVVVTLCGIVVAACVTAIAMLWWTSADIIRQWRIK